METKTMKNITKQRTPRGCMEDKEEEEESMPDRAGLRL
jgi:hypothetical protein